MRNADASRTATINARCCRRSSAARPAAPHRARLISKVSSVKLVEGTPIHAFLSRIGAGRCQVAEGLDESWSAGGRRWRDSAQESTLNYTRHSTPPPVEAAETTPIGCARREALSDLVLVRTSQAVPRVTNRTARLHMRIDGRSIHCHLEPQRIRNLFHWLAALSCPSYCDAFLVCWTDRCDTSAEMDDVLALMRAGGANVAQPTAGITKAITKHTMPYERPAFLGVPIHAESAGTSDSSPRVR